MFRIVEGGDDGRLDCARQQRGEAQLGHAGDERGLVALVAGIAGGNAALGGELLHGLGKGAYHMGGRGEAPFAAAFFHGLPLVVEVEAQGPGLAGAAFEHALSGQDEAEAGHALDALVGAGNERVRADVRHVDGHAAEAAHGVHDVDFPGRFDRRADGLDGVEHAGGGLAVDHGHVADLGMGGEKRCDPGRVHGIDFAEILFDDRDVQHPGDLGDARAVGPVGEHEQAGVFVGQKRADAGFHAERAAALHEGGGVAGRFAGQGRELLAQVGDDAVVVRVPGAPVAQHGRLDGLGRGQGPRGEQQIRIVRVAGKIHGVTPLAGKRGPGRVPGCRRPGPGRFRKWSRAGSGSARCRGTS